ncbi:MAG: efflux RND transporter periplasmic adaptor subunit [Planctomycetota bacterium]
MGWIVASIILVVVGAFTLAALSGADDAAADDAATVVNDGEWYKVQRRSFDLTVVESGDLDTAERLELKSRVEGRPVIMYVVEEGAEVEEGDLLVRLETEDLRTKIEETSLNVEKARADEVYARRGLEIEREEAKSVQAVAEVNLDLARLELAKWQQGDVPQMRRELDLELQKAKRLVERTKRDYEISQQLYAKKFISLNDLEDSEIDQIEAIDALATAELALEVYDQYTYKTEEQEKLSAVDQATSDLAREIAKAESEIARLEADLNSKTQTLAIREERLRKLNEQLAASEMKAPRDGIVVYATSVGRRSWRNDPIAEGREVRFNEAILYLPDVEQMVANLSVAEAYEPLVEIGQPVRITVDARPGQIYEGVIDRKTPLAESGGWLNPGQREFTVRVMLPPDSDDTLSPAMRCTGEITVGRVDDALAVPIQAVFTEGDQHFCYVPAGGGYVHPQPVEIGRASETLVEITEGLEPGDRVLLRNPLPGELRDGA